MPNLPKCPKCDARLLLVEVRPINVDVGMHRYECASAISPRGSDLGKSKAHFRVEHRTLPVMITIVEC